MHSVFILGKRNSLEVSEGVQVLWRQGRIEPAAVAWLQMCLLLFGMKRRWMKARLHACLDLDWYRSRASAPSPYNVSRLIGIGARTSSGRSRLQGTVTRSAQQMLSTEPRGEHVECDGALIDVCVCIDAAV